MVLRYLGDTPLKALTATYIRNRELRARQAALAVGQMCQATKTEAAMVDSALEYEEADSADIAYVQHRSTKRTHVISSKATEFLGLEDLQCLCKWQANLRTTLISDEKPMGEICKDCLKLAPQFGLAL